MSLILTVSRLSAFTGFVIIGAIVLIRVTPDFVRKQSRACRNSSFHYPAEPRMATSSGKVIRTALAGNSPTAITNVVSALMTGSPAMLPEAIR